MVDKRIGGPEESGPPGIGISFGLHFLPPLLKLRVSLGGETIEFVALIEAQSLPMRGEVFVADMVRRSRVFEIGDWLHMWNDLTPEGASKGLAHPIPSLRDLIGPRVFKYRIYEHD